MTRHRTYSIEIKRQVAQEFLGGETLYGLARRMGFAGVGRARLRTKWWRCLKFGANTPWYRVSWARGRGTSAARRATASDIKPIEAWIGAFKLDRQFDWLLFSLAERVNASVRTPVAKLVQGPIPMV